jgi:hypothetical protein
MRLLSVLIVAVLVCFPPSRLIAQQSDTQLIDAVVVGYVTSGYAVADVAIDPNELVRDSSARLIARRNESRARAIAAELGIRTAERADVITCGGIPRLCRLTGAGMHLQLSVPEILDSAATVVVRQYFATGDARMPMAYRRLRLFLVLKSGAWHVEREEIQVLS